MKSSQKKATTNMTSLRNNFYIQVFTFLSVAGLLLSPQVVGAYFSSGANAEQNTYQAGEVETDTSTDTLDLDIDRDNSYSTNFTFTDQSTIDGIIHNIESAPKTCDANFYNGIDIVGDWDSINVYDADLSSLQATSTNDGNIGIEIETNSSMQASQNDTCVVTLTITTWQEHFSQDTYGFSTTKDVELTITATEDIGAQATSNIVLNEIYPATLSTTTEPLDREWVELYNGTNNSIDVAGWSISEFTSGSTTLFENLHTVVNDCSNAPNVSEYMQPYGTNNTVVPAGGYIVLEFCGSAEYLYDDGDTVTLYDVSSTQIDTHTYPATANGKSHARIPDGSDWVDPIPTPGKPNNATREDLQAEGWSEDKIDRVLLELEKHKQDKERGEEQDDDLEDEAIRDEEDEKRECVKKCKEQDEEEEDKEVERGQEEKDREQTSVSGEDEDKFEGDEDKQKKDIDKSEKDEVEENEQKKDKEQEEGSDESDTQVGEEVVDNTQNEDEKDSTSDKVDEGESEEQKDDANGVSQDEVIDNTKTDQDLQTDNYEDSVSTDESEDTTNETSEEKENAAKDTEI